MSLPPKPGEQSAHRVRDDIPNVADCVWHNVRTNPFEENGPNDELKNDLGRTWWFIVQTQFQPSLHEEHWRQGAGDEPQIIEVRVEKCIVQMWLQPPPVHRVGETAQQEKRVAKIKERLHFKREPE